jgi:hypothetical protein
MGLNISPQEQTASYHLPCRLALARPWMHVKRGAQKDADTETPEASFWRLGDWVKLSAY